MTTTAESLDAAATSTNSPFESRSEASQGPLEASLSTGSTDWQRLFSSMNAAHDPFEKVEIDPVTGAITIMPRPNAWYLAFRGGLLYRPAEGNFVVRVKVRVTGRDGRTIPEAPFSLAGLLIRSADANPAGENFVFHTLGVTDVTGGWQFQSMSTVDGQSRIDRRDATGAEAELLVARFRSTLQLWARQNAGDWIQLGQLDRTDLPEQVQVGLMASTDWPACEAVGAAKHNAAGVANGRPDLVARFTEVRIEPLSNLESLRNQLHTASVVGNDRKPMVADPPPSPPSAPSAPSSRAVGPPSPTPSPIDTPHALTATDELAALSDEFDDPKTLANWLRVYQVEKSGADQLQSLDIDRTTRGWMTLVPYTSSWYRDWRGVLVHKNVRGDFIVTTRVRATNRAGNGPPSRPFSLAGIMVRTPREITPQTWQPGDENYIFLSLGTADQPGTFQFEVKTTLRSDSQLEISAAPGPEALIRVARIGAHFILLKKPVEGAWTVHRRYERPDMPAELQVGMTVYTDWQNVERIPPAQHNRTVIRTGNPDLLAAFEFFRFRRPTLSNLLRQRGRSEVSQIPDDELARLLDLTE